LNNLPSEQREAIELAFFEYLSHHEIAARLGQPLGTVKARIRRGLLKLRQRLNTV
jgi:RNA polymerase sigma-70 factor (ECF subfamily)